MADNNPTGRGVAVALRIPADHRGFLHATFEYARAGVREELSAYPPGLGAPVQLRREESAYTRLLAALEEGAIVPDPDLRAVLRDLAQIIDESNEFVRVVGEHEALHGLLGQLGGAQRPVACAATREEVCSGTARR